MEERASEEVFALTEMSEEILRLLSDDELRIQCQVNSRIRNICLSEDFWQRRILQRYNMLQKYYYLFGSWHALYHNIINNAYYVTRLTTMKYSSDEAHLMKDIIDALDYISNKSTQIISSSLDDILKLDKDTRNRELDDNCFEIFIMFKDIIMDAENAEKQLLFRLCNTELRPLFISKNLTQYPILPEITRPVLYFNEMDPEYKTKYPQYISSGILSLTKENLRFIQQTNYNVQMLLRGDYPWNENIIRFNHGSFIIRNTDMIDIFFIPNGENSVNIRKIEFTQFNPVNMIGDDDVLLELVIQGEEITIDDL